MSTTPIENDLINQWSITLAERLVDIRFIDLDEMKTAISSYMKSALMDCLAVQISNTRSTLDSLKIQYNTRKGNSNVIAAEIVKTKQRLKAENQMFAHLDRDLQAKELVKWMRKNHEDSLLKFYKTFETVRIKIGDEKP